MSVSDKSLNQNDQRVLNAILTIFINKKRQNEIGKGNVNEEFCWITTREVAEYCDITIYRARLSLIRLEKYGVVEHRPAQKKTKLNWKPTGKQI